MTNPSESVASAAPVPQPLSSALKHPGFRLFFISFVLVMSADFIEHVISYWVLFSKFHETWIAGFAVISHWVPFLLLSIHSGSLGDRFDPRRVIQAGLLVFMGVSICWGLLFYTDRLQIWHALVLLVLHGLAGVLWSPAAQLLLHDMVKPQQLPSAIRLIATARNLGVLAGPAIGALLLHLGADVGIFINALLYLPTILWLWKAPYGPRFRKGVSVPTRPLHGFADILDTLRVVRSSPTLLSMTVLAGATSLFVGNAYQAQMPELAQDLGPQHADMVYGLLLGADAVGAVLAAIVLEARGFLSPSPRAALVFALVWCAALVGFAFSTVFPVAVALLVIAGFVELGFSSMAQTLVQLDAPAPIRGRVIGVFMMSSLGMRTFSGITVGLVGAVIGVHYSLALSASVLFVLIIGLLAAGGRAAPRGMIESASGSLTPKK